MINRLIQLFGRAKFILQTEGLIPLIRQGFAFLLDSFFQYRIYYLYQEKLQEKEEMNEADSMPRIQDFTFKIVSTHQQSDELVADGFEFRYSEGIHRERLDKGAIAFCIFFGRELAHIAWLIMTEEAKRSIHGLPIQVDFSNNEALHGYGWTKPKYRGMRLNTYTHFKRRQFCRERGITVLRAAVAVLRGNLIFFRAISLQIAAFNQRIAQVANILTDNIHRTRQ